MSHVICLLLTLLACCAALADSLPDVPAMGAATAGDQSITVSFVPGALGSGQFVEYMAVCNNSVQSGTASPITVKGLTNGTAYGCRVRVTTTAGTSAWSALSNVVTPAAAPLAGGVRAIGSRQPLLWLGALIGFAAAGAGLVAFRRRRRAAADGATGLPLVQRVSDGLVLMVLGALWIPGLLALGMFVTGKTVADPSAPLIGVQEKRRHLSGGFQALMDGEVQKQVAAAVVQWVPLYATITRVFNQVQYAVFHTSSNREILVGRDGYLLHTKYTATYCNRDITAEAANLEAWAKMIAEIQRGFQLRGQKFVFVLTPSKVEYFSDKLPLGYPCPSRDRDIFIPEAIEYLKSAGVNYVDATAKMSEVHARYGYEPFPRSGIHWTELAASGSANEIIERLGEMPGNEATKQPPSFAVQAGQASWEEQDFANLLNLLWLPPADETAKMVRAVPALKDCPPPMSMVVVGNSFFTALARNLVARPCAPTVRQLFYFSVHQRHFYAQANDPKMELESLDFDLLKTADAVVLEEHAGIFANTSYTPALHKYITEGVLPQSARNKR